MSKYDDVLKPFVAMMEKELHANAGKGDRPGWLAMSAGECLLEIYYHLSKLQKAIKDSDGDRIAEYSANVANMAMMAADICGALYLSPIYDIRPQHNDAPADSGTHPHNDGLDDYREPKK